MVDHDASANAQPSAAADAARRREVDRIFSAALDLSPDERDAHVRRACAGDAALRLAVQRLLAAERDSVAVFDAAAACSARTLDALLAEPAGEDTQLGRQLGAYVLLRRIGQGGMAVVYLGERADAAFDQRVAVKLLRRTVDAAEDVARFKLERQILSALQHPHIAHLIDGGTTDDGQPYLVTEFVDGLPITEHCQRQGLGVEARLDLFLQVADAVHHAHQNLVVHRDLKPSNILVDGAGRVRLLDFGIAKLLDVPGQPGQVALTRIGHFVMTPEYAAPEQLTGREVTTATDVYQLGILLHELLTGVRPDSAAGDPAAATGTVPRPSRQLARDTAAAAPPIDRARLARRLRGDLDVVMQAALQPDPGRRYASAAMLAADIRNHLRGRPISARPEGMVDLLRRLSRRSPFAVAAAALALVSLAGWLLSLQSHAQALTRERDAAAAQAQRASRANDLLLGVFRRANPLEHDSVGGRDATVWQSIHAATDGMRAALKDDPGTLAALLGTLAGLHRAGGQAALARELQLEVLALQRALTGPASAAVAIALGELGSVESLLGNGKAAAAYLAQAVQIAGKLPPEAALGTVSVFLDAGHAAVDAGDAKAALRHFERADALLNASPHPDPNARIETLFGQGNGLMQLGQPERAEALILASVQLAESVYGADHARLSGPLSALGNVQRRLGRPLAAVATLRRAIAILERAYGPSAFGTLTARGNLALALGDAGDRRGEQQTLGVLIALRRASLGPDHVVLADLLQNLGSSLGRTGDSAQALAALGEARRIYDAALPPGSPRRAFPRLTAALVHLQANAPGPAGQAAAAAVAILAQTLPADHFVTAIGRCLQGEALVAQGALARGRALIAAALPLVEQAPREQADYLARCRAAHARALREPRSR